MVKRVLLRAVRGVVSMGVGIVLARYGNDPSYLWITPALSSAGKFLRERFPRWAGAVPF
jgi:hypothetical protein